MENSKLKAKNSKLKLKTKNFLVLSFGFTFYILRFTFAQEIPVTTKNEEVKGFTMTIVDKGGKEKAAVTGSVANILQGGLVEILEVVARIYGQEVSGSDTLVHTSKGIYNRPQNVITTDQFVRINKRDMVITGTGLEWMPDRSKLEIEENVRVEYFTEQENKKRITVITSCGNGVMDYNKNVAVFKREVEVQDQDATLKAHRMKMFFNKDTQELTRVEAYGNVKIKQPKRESTSHKAVYYAGEDKIVLTGDPRIAQGLDFYTADRVTIYDKGNRVVFEPKAQLVIYASTEHDV